MRAIISQSTGDATLLARGRYPAHLIVLSEFSKRYHCHAQRVSTFVACALLHKHVAWRQRVMTTSAASTCLYFDQPQH